MVSIHSKTRSAGMTPQKDVYPHKLEYNSHKLKWSVYRLDDKYYYYDRNMIWFIDNKYKKVPECYTGEYKWSFKEYNLYTDEYKSNINEY